jgi:hypothetical protein
MWKPRSPLLVHLDVLSEPFSSSVDGFEAGCCVQHLSDSLSNTGGSDEVFGSDEDGPTADVGVLNGMTLLVLCLRCEDPRLVVHSSYGLGGGSVGSHD